MGMRGLAEGIIVQSLEDLWNDQEREEAVEFFQGDGFSICAEIAGMSLYEQVRLFNLVSSVLCSMEKAGGTGGSGNEKEKVLSC